MTDSTNYFIAWWSAVYSRLAYLNPQQFLGRYTEIFGDKVGNITNGVAVGSDDNSGGALPTTSVLSMMQNQATGIGIQGLLDDTVMLKLNLPGTNAGNKRWGLNVITVDALNASVKPTTLTLDCITNYVGNQPVDAFGEASAVASWAEKVNIILGERRKMKEDENTQNGGGLLDILKKTNKVSPAPAPTPEMLKNMLNCAPELVLKDNPMLVFRAISDSNYGTVYVFGDRRAPNLVWIVFRGTANAKSAGSYTRPSSLTATGLVNFFGINDAGLAGIFKILQEMIHCILQMAVDVATELNPNPAVPLANGSIKLLTTGHSLGGALATAFAGEYVQQISSNLSSIEGASIFDINIGCYSLASPRIYGPQEAAAFCCLTQAGELCKTDPTAQEIVGPDSNVKGRISYLRVVTTLDLVTALPKLGYQHPCSEFKMGQREKISMDCDIESGKTLLSKGNSFITNKVSTRCLGSNRPSMTADFSKAPVCTDQRKTTLSISSILYHLTYCGIMFAGGVDITSALSLDVERLQPEDVKLAAVDPVALKIKADDTVMRILWYGVNNSPVAKCVFFDLAPFRVNETMAQAAPAAAPSAPASTPSAPASTPSAPASTPAAASSTTAAAPAAASSNPAPAPSTQTDSSVLLEDSGMTKSFLDELKKAITDGKYTYPIKDASFKPPILYRPPTVKGGVPPPQQYNYLYQLPTDVSKINIKSNYVLFFGKSYTPTVDDDVADAHAGQELLLPELPPLPQPPAPAKKGFLASVFNRSSAPAVAITANVGGRRTRRLHKLKSRKHKKGKKVARVSRRKHRSRTKRH
jgi:hypothetical protein